MGAILLAARVTLGAVFAVAGLAKLLNKREFEASLFQLDIHPRLAVWTARLLPIAELVVAAAFLPSTGVAPAAVAAIGLLIIVSAVRLVQLRRGSDADCRCFGPLRAFGSGYWLLVRNGLFIALAALLAAMAPTRSSPSATRWTGDLSPTTWIAASALLVLLLTAAATAVVAHRVLQQQSFMLTRLETLEMTVLLAPASDVEPPRTNAEPPSANGIPINGGVSLDQRLDLTEQTWLVFVEASCKGCEALLRTIADQPTVAASAKRAVLVVSGDYAGLRARVDAWPNFDEVVADNDNGLAKACGVYARPAAVLVSQVGEVLDSTIGLDGILARLEAERPGSPPSAD